MEEYENKNNDEYTNEPIDNGEQTFQGKHDPAAEAKGKIIFFVVVVAIMIVLKYVFKF